MPTLYAASGSSAENLFIELFSDTFGAEKAGYLYSQYHFYDIYQNSRFADFLLENGSHRIAIEVDDEASHNKQLVASGKFYDDLLKQNSMVHLGWDVYRFAVRQMQIQPDTIKDELRVFLGAYPQFKEIEDYLPSQRAKSIDAVNLELKEHQKAALKALQGMRTNHETIGLLYHATGTGKTVTAVMDAKSCAGRTLFLAHTHELVAQAVETFESLWPEVTIGRFVDTVKEPDTQVVCGSIQSVALNLDKFKESDFNYLIIDEAHHASADTYQKVIAYFKPQFTLGLTATPERMDDNTVILDIFKKTAHKLDIQTAVEIGELVSVRCIRIHTNIDLTKVRFNSVQYNIRDLENKIYVPERNKLIVDTWLQYVKDRRTVVFCASVKHAKEIASLFSEACVTACSVSGGMKASERQEHLAKFASGEIKVLCACDLLNEGWDCPQTEVLFMARPTMSKVLYTQQLGRGMRLAEGKDCLMVFDFVDNASQYNIPQSLHRLFQLKDYHAGGLALSPNGQLEAEKGLYARGEKPDALIDWPVDATDYELVDIFNWQAEAAGMISQMEFVRRVDVQSETIEKYVRDGKLVPDLVVPMSEHRMFKYFKEETLHKYAEQYGWTLIDDSNRKDLFMEMIKQMDMSYSYKPVLIKAVIQYADNKGRVRLDDIVTYFRSFFENRRKNGLVVEKAKSVYLNADISDKEILHNILIYPYKRFEDMSIMRHTKTLGIIQVDETIWKHLNEDEKAKIEQVCNEKLMAYFQHLENKG
ncbi:DEAD/DEAH box helicase [Papillibacter cinnamivorans]|uniref:Helicase conserved C-terminal domain-containing protein n=1 Tax=Papillibacter cinnamivorans DSM 12816 TaxID=1122930 RepID=A0A1W2ANW2_9FIRM|nr:DEAD/DEAH box helicase [Papillibacter cinnamivorans]SMC62210.1 Helicase conserved C-terminal domain-containing protein [Papillibacter cinnamivorans DSM 12816]